MNIGCWNVQGLSTKTETLPSELEKYEVDIVVLSETKRKGRGEEILGNYIHFWSGVEKHQRAKAGISILIRKKLRNRITGWEYLNERMLIVHLQLFGREVTIIGLYAPTNDMPDTMKELFWNQVSDLIEKLPKRRDIILLGDMNARVGREEIKNVMGKFGEEERNDNGDKLIQLCEEQRLQITNTFFQHRMIHKFTWRQETRQLKSIIDCMIIRQINTIKVKDIRVFRGADCGFDHFLLKAKCVFPFTKQRTIFTGKKKELKESTERVEDTLINIESLQDESISMLYLNRINNEIDENFDGNATEIYEYIKEKTKKIANEVLGTIDKNENKNHWIHREIKDEIKEKKIAYMKWMSSKNEEDKNIYREKRRNLNHRIRSLKNEYWDRKCAEINSYLGYKRSAQVWKMLKNMRKGETHKTNLNLIQLEQWVEYYKELLTEERTEFKEKNKWTYEGTDITVTIEEVIKSIKCSKNGKASGPGAINNELLKNGGKKIAILITRLINKILIEGEVPHEMRTGYISSIFKKGDKSDCTNYRGICVTNPITKIIGRILRNRLEDQFNTPAEQCGFTAGKSCVNHIFTMRQILEKAMMTEKEIHMIFIDLQKAYDTVPRMLLYKALKKAGINESLINVIKLLYKDNICKVKIGKKLSEEFPTSKGLLQGCCMSPTLFKIYIDVVLKDWIQQCENMGIKIGNKHLIHLLFADDQVIITQTKEDLKYVTEKALKAYNQWGLKINYKKTEHMTTGTKEDIVIDGSEIKSVQAFKYLGSILEQDGSSDMEIKKRISDARKIIGILNSILWSRNIIEKTKRTIFNTLIESVLLYGAETWTIKSANEKKLLSTEMDFWRRSARTSRLERKTNIEIRARMNVEKNIIDKINKKRLQWYGHVQRMNAKEIPQLALNWKPEGKNKRGRPRKRWRDKLIRDMMDHGLNEEDTQDRERWREKIKTVFG